MNKCVKRQLSFTEKGNNWKKDWNDQSKVAEIQLLTPGVGGKRHSVECILYHTTLRSTVSSLPSSRYVCISEVSLLYQCNSTHAQQP